jgi:hypothetical protein
MTLSVLLYAMMLCSLAALVGVLGFDAARSLRHRARARTRAGRVTTYAAHTADGPARPRMERSHAGGAPPGGMRPAPSRARRRAPADSCR